MYLVFWTQFIGFPRYTSVCVNYVLWAYIIITRTYMDMIIIALICMLINNQFLLDYITLCHTQKCLLTIFIQHVQIVQSNNWGSQGWCESSTPIYDTPFQWSESSTPIIMTHHISRWCESSTPIWHTISVVCIQHTNMTHHFQWCESSTPIWHTISVVWIQHNPGVCLEITPTHEETKSFLSASEACQLLKYNEFINIQQHG